MGQGVDHGAPVGHVDPPGKGVEAGEQDLLGKLHGHGDAGLEGGEGIRLHVVQVHLRPGGHRVVLPEKDAGVDGHHLVELQIPGRQILADELLRGGGEEDDPQVAPLFEHVADHGVHAALPQVDLKLFRGQLLEIAVKGLDDEGIPLGGDGEAEGRRRGRLVRIKVQDAFLLLQQRPCEVEKFPSVLRQHHALPGPGEDGDPQLVFQLLQHAAEVGLGDVKFLGGFADGPMPGDLRHISDLLQGQCASSSVTKAGETA